jgi:hypothetical protein
MRDDESKGGCNSSNDKDKKYSTGIRGIIILVLHNIVVRVLTILILVLYSTV